MVKFKRLQGKDIKNNSLHRWLSFFDKDTPEDVLKEVLSMETAIMKANEKISFLASDREAMRLYEMREMALSDFTSGINNARRESAIEIAKRLLKRGTPVEHVAEDTGLDVPTINQLEAEQDKG
jgi:predicted transposase/invertase (TIGR01784 family)